MTLREEMQQILNSQKNLLRYEEFSFQDNWSFISIYYEGYMAEISNINNQKN